MGALAHTRSAANTISETPGAQNARQAVMKNSDAVDELIISFNAVESTLNLAQTGGTISLTNANTGTITLGQAVYASAAGACNLARADNVTTAEAIGLVLSASVATAETAIIQTHGVITTGLALTTGTEYYLSASTAGAITATAPTTAGQYSLYIGTAISTTQLKINIGQPILL